MKAQCIIFSGKDKVEVRDTTVRDPGPGEVLIAAKYTCVSPGTELRCLAGMQSNSPAFPFVAGYALAGEVIKTGEGVDLKPGAKVFCGGTKDAGGINVLWGGHISHAVCKASDVCVIPDGVSLKDASLTRMAAIAFHGYRLSKPVAGERVAVIGLGILGQLSARLHAMSGAHTVCCDMAEFRVKQAAAAGLSAVVVKGTLRETFAPELPNGADIIVDVTGVPAVIGEAVDLAHEVPWDDSLTPGARYICQGSYPDTFAIKYSMAFMKQVSFILPRSDQPRDQRAVLDLMARGKLKVADLLTEVRRPSEAARTYAQLQDRKSPLLTVAFQWD
jgi:2-desacetyl-2-hydroxyethyl bacteriochlorophyllide A dehydrogenase